MGLSFGPDVTADFLERNGLKLLVRSHEVKDAGCAPPYLAMRCAAGDLGSRALAGTLRAG